MNEPSIFNVDENLIEFLKDVKFTEHLGFYGENLKKHLCNPLNDRTLIALLEYNRADLTNA